MIDIKLKRLKAREDPLYALLVTQYAMSLFGKPWKDLHITEQIRVEEFTLGYIVGYDWALELARVIITT